MKLHTLAQRIGAAVLLMMVCVPASAGVCRVTVAGTIFNDGSSWATPATCACSPA